MLVYKFGGASVASADGIKRVLEIIKSVDNRLIIVVSAMAKTTNKLEEVLDNVLKKDFIEAERIFDEIKEFHQKTVLDLKLKPVFLEHIFTNILEFIQNDSYSDREYEYRYDALVSYGEMLSSAILSVYLAHKKVANKLLDMREIIVTDSSFRDAKVNHAATSQRINRAMSLGFNIYITQGFIGGNTDGEATTLGREGSDYSAAIIASCINCDSVTLWKDVDGIYNADPKQFKEVELIPQLPYSYAVELAFSGAQIIHSKTIKPLENKNISLYIKPFYPSLSEGTVINSENRNIDIAILTVKSNQILVSIRPKDLSFILEECMEDILSMFNIFKQKINLIQVSGVSVSISTDNTHHFAELIENLQEKYRVSFNENVEILTIMNYTSVILRRERKKGVIYLEQQTRRSIKLLRKLKK